jgi:acyl homoserine lactone synthase/acyl-homoserine lactone synthase
MPITACQRSTKSQGDALRVMFEARKRVFVDLLGWDLPVLDGTFELDQFDDDEALYLIITQEDGAHLASARLLRTDRPHLLADVFAHLCEVAIPSGPDVREITRFCLDPRPRASERRQARDCLVKALVEHALEHGITDYTGVASVGWFEQVARFGWDCQALGAPVASGAGKLVALHIRIDESTPASMRTAGILAAEAATRVYA